MESANGEEEHDFTDLRDPFATRSPPRSASVLRSSVSSGGSASESGSVVGHTRMSAWGRLQFPVRLPLHGTSVGGGATANVGLGMGGGKKERGTCRSGSRGRVRSHHQQQRRGGGGTGGEQDKRETDRDNVDVDDIQDSALLAQRLLRRLQGNGHGHVGSGSWVGGKYPAPVGSAV
jgi:hypothetical protein